MLLSSESPLRLHVRAGRSYTFLVDFDGTGTSSLGGVTTTKIGDGKYDYFYVRFVSGTNLYPRPAADPADTVSYNYGFDYAGSFYSRFIFGTPTGYKLNAVNVSSGQPVSEWVVGNTMVGEDAVGSPLDPDFAWVVSSLELKSISAVPSPTAEAAKLITGSSDLPVPVFKNRNMRKAPANKLEAMVQMLGQESHAEALEKLRNDILKKTDGCAGTGGLSTCRGNRRTAPTTGPPCP